MDVGAGPNAEHYSLKLGYIQRSNWFVVNCRFHAKPLISPRWEIYIFLLP